MWNDEESDVWSAMIQLEHRYAWLESYGHMGSGRFIEYLVVDWLAVIFRFSPYGAKGLGADAV